jgi:ribosomal protein L11 methyltransferase
LTPCGTSQRVKHPGWLEIALDADPLVHDSLSDFLFTLGCRGIAQENSHAETLKVYFPLDKMEEIQGQLDLFLRKLEEIFPEARAPKLRICKIDEQDWSHAWRRFFRPEQITGKLVIVPAWERDPHIKDAHVIRMDPGPAFGTGQHATTRLCLETVETFRKVGQWKMLDVGTGTGILAIYGAMLGAREILALDNDPEALRWAERNIALNELPVPIHLSDVPVEALNDSFHLLVANLIFHVIQELIPHFSRLLKPRGWLILSGLLKDQVESVKTRLREHDLEPSCIRHKEEWACILAVKKPCSSPPSSEALLRRTGGRGILAFSRKKDSK